MRILLGNDDGIDASGLDFLAQAARRLSDDVWIVAPDRKWTAASHQLSFDRTIELVCRSDRVYSCTGAPADAVVAAMTILFDHDTQPDLVLAGVNDGLNVGEDVAYSGTLAVAREASFWGIPSIALSRPKGAPAGEMDADALSTLIAGLWAAKSHWWAQGRYLSVNLPVALPAPLAQARPGRDKIASTVEIVEREEQKRVRFRLRRRRPGTSHAGDENSLIASGRIALVCYAWDAAVQLPAGAFDRLAEAARSSDGTA
jgi:5'-nucleotidase